MLWFMLLYSFVVFKEKERSRVPKKEEPPPQPVFIPVVGAFNEPELKPTLVEEKKNNTKKRKTDLTQLPSDDYHFDRFRKKVKPFR